LYTGEARAVGEGYRDKLSPFEVKVYGEALDQSRSTPESIVAARLNKARQGVDYENPPNVRDSDAVASVMRQIEDSQAAAARDGNFDLFSALQDQKNALSRMKDAGIEFNSLGHLYKTDIPDEAVARMLDWDKPLSQQAPEVYEAIRQMYMQKKITVPSSGPVGSMVHDLGMNLGAAGDASKYLASQGIPGIRYLDQGSRSAGQGTSNFVVFDPEIIRILERNGEATGAVPWAPGEWKGLLSP
jgi:hypothetical protein